MKRLDPDRPYVTVFGEAPHAFSQDGILFDPQGNEIVAEAPAEAANSVPVAAEPAGSVAEQMRRLKAKE